MHDDNPGASTVPEMRGRSLVASGWVFWAGTSLVFAGGTLKSVLLTAAAPQPAAGSEIKQFWAEILPLFIVEIGIAFIIAWVIARMFDKQQRELEEERARRDGDEAKRREEQMVQNVFRGVLGIEHTATYVTAVIETTLKQNIIRGRVNLVYVITDYQVTEEGEGLIVLDQSVTYELFNRSSTNQPHEIKFTLPVPYSGPLFEASHVYAAAIDVALEPHEIAEVMKPAEGIERAYCWTREIPANGKISVSVKAKVIKRCFDTDVWSSIYPSSEGMSLHVVAPKGYKMWIRNNTSTKVFPEKDTVEDGIGEWHINGPILPNNSVALWWRKGPAPINSSEIRQ